MKISGLFWNLLKNLSLGHLDQIPNLSRIVNNPPYQSSYALIILKPHLTGWKWIQINQGSFPWAMKWLQVQHCRIHGFLHYLRTDEFCILLIRSIQQTKDDHGATWEPIGKAVYCRVKRCRYTVVAGGRFDSTGDLSWMLSQLAWRHGCSLGVGGYILPGPIRRRQIKEIWKLAMPNRNLVRSYRIGIQLGGKNQVALLHERSSLVMPPIQEKPRNLADKYVRDGKRFYLLLYLHSFVIG